MIGDHCEIHPSVRIDCDEFSCGDYVKIHQGTWIRGKKVTLGHCVWVGQDCILDGQGELTVKDFVGIGAGSQLWSHVAHGDRLQGCTLYGEKPLTIEEDAWLVGHCLVSPVWIGEKSVALLGSVVTEGVPAKTVVGGAPAHPVMMRAWEDVPLEEKERRFQSLLDEFYEEFHWCPMPHHYNLERRTYHKSPSLVEFNKWLFRGRAYFRPEE